MIINIKQRDWEKGDCGIACVAMISHKTYEETFDKFCFTKKDNLLTFHKDLIDVLQKFNISSKRRHFKSWDLVKTPAIVAIDHDENHYWHWIVLDEHNGKKVMYDPNPKVPNEIYSIEDRVGYGQYIQVIDK